MNLPSIKDYVMFLSDLLCITPPEIKYTDTLLTKSQLAMMETSSEVCVLHLKNGLRDFMVYFAISHEMRHLYQFYNNETIFESYMRADQTNKDLYNRQPAEIDANAFALICMSNFFGVEPNLKEVFNEDIIQLIKKRAKEIIDEFK